MERGREEGWEGEGAAALRGSGAEARRLFRHSP